MIDNASVYDAKPWLAHYGEAIIKVLPPPRHLQLAELLTETSMRYARQIAFTTCMPNGMNASLTFEQVQRHSDTFAVYLREVVGLSAGARVALQTPNCLAYPVVAFGVLKAGCVLVNTNPLYTSAEMEHQFCDSGAEVLVIVDIFADKVEAIRARTSIRTMVVCEVSQFFSPVPRGVIRLVMKWWNKVLPPIVTKHLRLDRALAEGEAARVSRKVDVAAYTRSLGPETLAVLQYTGGTTGVPKGAMLTHGNLLANIDQSLAMGRSHIEEGKEVVLTALPLYHIFAFTFNLLCFYTVGARNILAPNPRPIQNLQRAFDNYSISWISGVNTLFNALLNEEWFTAFPPKHIKVAVAGGAALQHTIAERWEKVTGTRIAEGYGLTESSPVVSFNPMSGMQKPDSIGIPVPSTAVRLVDDAGQSDVAVMDADGYFKIVDRKKDMILVSGFNVYPNEIEDVIAAMDEVLEVGVIGVPDAQTGEAVHAYVVPLDKGLTEDAVRAHCRKYLTDYKLPNVIEFRHELPKTPIGKILRKSLRAEYAAQAGAAR